MLPVRITAVFLALTLVFSPSAFALRPRSAGLEEKTAITRQLEGLLSGAQPSRNVPTAGLEVGQRSPDRPSATSAGLEGQHLLEMDEAAFQSFRVLVDKVQRVTASNLFDRRDAQRVVRPNYNGRFALFASHSIHVMRPSAESREQSHLSFLIFLPDGIWDKDKVISAFGEIEGTGRISVPNLNEAIGRITGMDAPDFPSRAQFETNLLRNLPTGEPEGILLLMRAARNDLPRFLPLALSVAASLAKSDAFDPSAGLEGISGLEPKIEPSSLSTAEIADWLYRGLEMERRGYRMEIVPPNDESDDQFNVYLGEDLLGNFVFIQRPGSHRKEIKIFLPGATQQKIEFQLGDVQPGSFHLLVELAAKHLLPLGFVRVESHEPDIAHFFSLGRESLDLAVGLEISYGIGERELEISL